LLQDKLTLYPGTSLVQNIGCDSSGSHCDSTNAYFVELAERPVSLSGIAIEEDPQARKAIGAFFKTLRPSIGKYIARKIRRLAKMISRGK
jgi:hypothetical protein